MLGFSPYGDLPIAAAPGILLADSLTTAVASTVTGGIELGAISIGGIATVAASTVTGTVVLGAISIGGIATVAASTVTSAVVLGAISIGGIATVAASTVTGVIIDKVPVDIGQVWSVARPYQITHGTMAYAVMSEANPYNAESAE